MLRTDYSDRRGGALGYITNDKYRNGNFVDRILSDMVLKTTPDTTDNRVYKRIKHPNTDNYSMPQYYGMIMNGHSKEIKTVSDRIHDAIFVTNNRYLAKLKKFGEDRSELELQAMIKNIQGSGQNWKPTYEALKKEYFL